jgi:hypothetical protein
LVRASLVAFLGIVPISCGPSCGEIVFSPAPPSSEFDFVVTFPEEAKLIWVSVVPVPENPSRIAAWSLKQESAGRLPNPLRFTYGIVPKGMAEEEKALPLKEGSLVRLVALYSTGSWWNPDCPARKLYRRVGGRFVEAPEGRE